MILKISLCALVVALVSGGALWWFFRMPQRTFAERQQQFPAGPFPVEAPVEIRWNPYAVPYIRAGSMADLAFALGLVHTHLRWTQLEIFRRLSQGRMAEMGGPWAVEFDRALRTFRFGKAAPAMIAAMPPETRLWCERFLAGINHYVAHHRGARPREFRWLGITPTPWTLEELVGVWRLASADVNWMVLLGALRASRKGGWAKAWTAMLDVGAASHPSFTAADFSLGDALTANSRSGSNAVVVGKAKTGTGSALLAGDPHLGVGLPNFWLLAGLEAPGFHAVGMMIPGAPFVAIGRNPEIAWGGTNMWGLSSLLQKVTPDQLAAATMTEETIRVRGWRDVRITVRETELGPVISDVPLLKPEVAGNSPFVLRWMGHAVSDEVTAFLAANRARDFRAFRAAFAPYAVSGMNMLYADRAGHIGHVLAVRAPTLKTPRLPVLAEPDGGWAGARASTELPAAWDPKEGFIASANNRPTISDPPVGYFFSSNDRVDRLRERLASTAKIDLPFLRALQHDVHSLGGRRLVDRLRALPIRELGPYRAAWETLLAWDGEYTKESRGAAIFEAFFAHFAPRFLREEFGDAELAALFLRNPSWKGVLDAHWDARPVEKKLAWTMEALAAASHEPGFTSAWGDVHRLKIAHVFGALPWVGPWFTLDEYGVDGGADTLMKTSGPLSGKRHGVSYGAQARQLIDLADPDANFFVLLGGQDGWLLSENTADQAALWKRGELIPMPLTRARVDAEFPTVTKLTAGI